MRTHERNHFVIGAFAACAALATSGCVLDRSPIRAPWATVAPQQYCPGDTLRASYQFFDGTCPTGLDCRLNTPNVTISSSPGLFPATPFTAYSGAVDRWHGR